MVDEQRTRVSAVLDIEDYERILGDLEELSPIRAYDSQPR